MQVTEIKGCRICGCKQLKEVYSLGEIYPSNFVADQEGYDKAPLILVQCPRCDFVQLKHSVVPDSMFRQYWYKSNLNKSMVADLKNIATSIEEKIELKDKDVVIDIGCNDGTLFKQYSNKNLFKLGFDPALNLKEEAEKNCTVFDNNYFNLDEGVPTAKVITSIAMFYDLPNPNYFVNMVKQVLDEKGIWVIQMTDLISMLLLNAFDNICHEHLGYYSLHVLNTLLRRHGLEIFDLEWNTVNGGSLRVYVSHKNTYFVTGNVVEGLMKEYLILNSTLGTFENFKERVEIVDDKLTDFFAVANINKHTILGLGASTKGNSLLQVFGINDKLLKYIAEVNPEKYGLRTIGTNIEIIPELKVLEMKPDYLFCLPWHFIGMMLHKNGINRYMRDGGKVVVPLPVPAVYSIDNGEIRKENL